MSGPKLISPLLDQFVVGDAISNHDGVRCYPAMRTDSDDKYILKVISIPASQVQLDALLLTGAYRDQASALAYFRELAEGTVKEAEVLQQLSKLESFDSYESWQIAPMEGGVGYDVYLLGAYRRSLEKYIRRNPMTHLRAVNLGLDLCSALAVCRRAGCLYADLKPSNVFISGDQTYHIGDLGFIPLASLKYASLPEKYRSSYTAPEITDAFSALNQTIDIYALGLILYQVYNNGELPFDGAAPTEPLPAPMYADYEMAEIILKACAINPEDRWQDPSAMGQALVSYMQRNSVNDTPIIPPVSEVPEAPVQAVPAEEVPPAEVSDLPEEAGDPETAPVQETMELPTETDALPLETEPETNGDDFLDAELEAVLSAEPTEEETDIPEDDITDLSFIDQMVSDETAPTEESTLNLTDAALSEETFEMLAQADELIAHEAPEPVVAPEPIDVPVPEPIVLEPEVAESVPAADEAEPDPEEPVPDETDEPEASAEDETSDTQPPAGEEDETDLPDKESGKAASKKKKHGKGWIAALIVLLLLAGLGYGGYYYYQNYYLQPISDIALEGAEAQLTVRLTSQIPDELLSIVCMDTYGNTKTAAVQDGVAVFTELSPATSYSITAKIDGFHQLTGNFTANYTTDALTNIVSFTANTGPTDGSVILNFTADGPEPDHWTVVYRTDGEEERQTTFSGHNVTVSDLTVGCDYTFRLAAEDLYLAGSDTITYTASKVLYAQNLQLISLKNNLLTLSWEAPEGGEGIQWSVTQYNEAGEILASVTVDKPEATLPMDDTSIGYLFEVIAEGMTQSTKISMTANPIIIASVLPDVSNPPRLYLQWGFEGPVPQGGWTVTVSADGSEILDTLSCESNHLELDGYIPGAVYTFVFQPADGTTVFDQIFTYQAPAAKSFEGYWVTAANFDFRMCRTPEVSDWDRTDLDDGDYTTTFTAGEKASFLLYVNRSYATSRDQITTTFVTRNSDGQPVLIENQTRTWSAMWYQRYCELDISQLPTEPGSYTMEIYFNGQAAGTQKFTIE